MRNKRFFNNIFDSICVTSLLVVCIAFYLLVIWFGVFNHKEGTDPIVTLIISTLIFGLMSVTTIVLIVLYCYDYWVLTDNCIYAKKLFRKRVEICLKEIEKVEKKTVPALILGIYKSDAYIIYSRNKKIVILIDGRKKFPALSAELDKLIG